jgi:prepilin-type N-terminal cleavage/methylation domain-containing protein
MNIQLKAKRQDGFTIIELVVVILLLGILAATALPRFMDVTDEAHEAVLEGLVGGLNSGSALFRATWVATGQNTNSTVNQFGDGSMYANSNGYPIGDVTTMTAAACGQIYENLLQSGRPSYAAAASGHDSNTDTDAAQETIVETATTANAAADIIAVNVWNSTVDANGDSTNDVADTTSCRFYYTAQFKNGTSTANVTVPYVAYSLVDGSITTDSIDMVTD